MKIICATDFSDNAKMAADVAVALSSAVKAKLFLVHVADEIKALKGDELKSFLRPIRKRLLAEARRLSGPGLTIETALLTGTWAEKAVVQFADKIKPDLVVVSAVSKSTFDRWTIGSVSERVAQRAPCPTLVVRAPTPFLEWLRSQEPLKVFVAVDGTSTSDAALLWVKQLKRFGPCAVTIGQANWPPEDRDRYGVGGNSFPENAPAVRTALERELRQRTQTLLKDKDLKVDVAPAWGQPDAILVERAAANFADLIIVGTHQCRGFERLWRRSVSRGVLNHSRVSVLCVPRPGSALECPSVPVFTRILVATDLSETGNSAIPHACAALPNGGTLHIVHVAPPLTSRRSSGVSGLQKEIGWLAKQLSRALPANPAELGITLSLTVLHSAHTGAAIVQEAERFGADLICLGSHGRSRIAKIVLGSVAEAVLARTKRPVMVVRPRAR